MAGFRQREAGSILHFPKSPWQLMKTRMGLTAEGQVSCLPQRPFTSVWIEQHNVASHLKWKG